MSVPHRSVLARVHVSCRTSACVCSLHMATLRCLSCSSLQLEYLCYRLVYMALQGMRLDVLRVMCKFPFVLLLRLPPIVHREPARTSFFLVVSTILSRYRLPLPGRSSILTLLVFGFADKSCVLFRTSWRQAALQSLGGREASHGEVYVPALCFPHVFHVSLFLLFFCSRDDSEREERPSRCLRHESQESLG